MAQVASLTVAPLPSRERDAERRYQELQPDRDGEKAERARKQRDETANTNGAKKSGFIAPKSMPPRQSQRAPADGNDGWLQAGGKRTYGRVPLEAGGACASAGKRVRASTSRCDRE